MEAKEKAKIICDVLSAKKAYDVLKIDVSEKTVLADYFIICSGKPRGIFREKILYKR